MNSKRKCRHLHLILGDQLDQDSVIFEDYDSEQDLLWMAETHEEATHVWCHKSRLVLFFSAMRHFRNQQQDQGREILYHELTADPSKDQGKNFEELLLSDLKSLQPEKIRVVLPGDTRVKDMLESVSNQSGIDLELLEDRHFYVSPEDFKDYSRGRKNLIMEHFYRAQRKRLGILVDETGHPEGGDWNYDKENRENFGKSGPEKVEDAPSFDPDTLTKEVIQMVESRYKDHPGSTADFHWPVTRDQALEALDHFITHRLPLFGKYEDAMWQQEHQLYHSALSAMLNLKLLNPRECVDTALEAYRNDKAPLNAVEGYVRQILGWREFIRGVYYQEMPGYADRNGLRCGEVDVPGFFWDGETDMACVKDSMQSVIRQGWSHHIQRLMVLGQFSLLYGVHPHRFHEWHMAMYVDAVDWVSLPNTLGMSQYGDSGIVGSKPYCASGNYIHKMSNYCKDCKYKYNQATGEDACPFTTLYWDFLDRHQQAFSHNRRMTFQMKNLERKAPDEIRDIKKRAEEIRERISSGKRI